MKLFYTFLLLFFLQSAIAQDPLFSQFYNNRVYLNPAFAGIDECLIIRFNYRNQWSKVPGGFTTYSATLEFPIKFINAGIAPFVFQDEEGTGNLKNFQAGLAMSFFHEINKTSSIHFGTMVSYSEKSANWEQFVFSDQLDPTSGLFDPLSGLLNQTSAPPIEKESYADLNIGILYWTALSRNKDKFISIGGTIHHLLTPNDDLSNIGLKTQRRYSIHSELGFPGWVLGNVRKKHFNFSPQFRFEYHQKVKTFTGGTYFSYQDFYIGGFLNIVTSSGNNTNSIILSGGINLPIENNEVRIIYSYDINSGGLYTKGGSVHEVSFIWQNCKIFKKRRSGVKGAKKYRDCFDF